MTTSYPAIPGRMLGPLDVPNAGELLCSHREHYDPATLLLQERAGIWFVRDITAPGRVWTPQDYYLEWAEIWKKYLPIFAVRLEDAPIDSLEEYLEIVYWLPVNDIRM